ncbi:MAG: aminoacyl-histidine dipeptidase [Niameybacter sp.]|uniref:aminoacyl-histidine dipeptidase n=1 Tax=Niameybacter sp. TaxID=2033640 RepID=UPI002FCA546E
MTRILGNLQPEKVMYYFEEISRIPRGSGNEKAISDYMVAFAKELHLEVKQDEAYNIYIKKPATKGYESAPTVILQGHLDMVCEKNKETQHDFLTEGIKLVVDGDFIRADGTTLGADNGISIAYQMAVLADNTIEHPALEALMTTAEETGMDGVANLHGDYLEGTVLLNLDTDIEGEFLVSCAGGAKAHVDLPVTYEVAEVGQVLYRVTVKGLTGGHSGADIHQERANANVLVGRVLDRVRQDVLVRVATFVGGSKDNVITREAESCFYVPEAAAAQVETVLSELEQAFKVEYEKQDSELKMFVEKLAETKTCLTVAQTNQLIDLLITLPHGIMAYSMQIPGLVESSLNIGVVQLEADSLRIVLAVRSSVPTKKENMLRKIERVAENIGAIYSVAGDYPAWVYSPHSRIRELASEIYEQKYGKKPEIKAIHAGLECGFILEKIPGVDIIAFGPNAYDIHSPEERASISSMIRVYAYLLDLLKAMKNY